MNPHRSLDFLVEDLTTPNIPMALPLIHIHQICLYPFSLVLRRSLGFSDDNPGYTVRSFSTLATPYEDYVALYSPASPYYSISVGAR